MKKFDFDFAYNETGHSHEKIKWLENNYKNPITADVFIEAMQRLRKFSNSKKVGKSHTPSSLRIKYNYLKKNYGFFPAND